MNRRIVILDEAINDPDEVSGYLSQQNLGAGFRLLDAVQQALGQLSRMPGLGERFETRNPSLEGLRCGSVPGFHNHRVFDLTHDDRIEIVRVWHAARDLEGLLGPENE
ncbi:MAG TPA: type II toxin-antitoxin system RelE/ParE family toxin [Isosphaeraceae bacterium]|nr:type II toxin-antitoxin system RelE/ParE family toxin [Isosphaeraceae bacterium]